MKKKLFLFLLLPLVLSSCTRGQKISRIEGFAIGTVYSVSVKGKMPAGMDEKIDSLFAAADASMSVFNPNSLLARINRNETDSLDIHLTRCIELAQRIGTLSGGKYDITVLPLVEAYGFAGKQMQHRVNTDSLLRFIGSDKIRIENGRLVKQYPETRIDLNSVAKGYIVDLLAQLVESQGVNDYLVNIGGEIFCRGTNASGSPWVVGIETPVEGNYVQGASIEKCLALSGEGVATSGNYRNFHTDASGNKFTHIIDPTTGRNTQSRLLSATVIAQSCALADALGTMFVAMGMDASLELLSRDPAMKVLLIYAADGGNMQLHASGPMEHYIMD